MADIKETNFEFVAGESIATMSTAESKWINRIKKLAEQYPDDVKIVAVNKDGSLLAHVPVKWFNLKPPVKRNLTDEQRAELSERMKHISRFSKQL